MEHGYEFAAGLPQPTLSTTAGQADLLGFIYNASKGKWLLVAVVTGFASTRRQPGAAAGHLPAVRFHDGPSSPVSYSGPFVCGVVIGVTSGGCWLDGYWWWVCPGGQSNGGAAVRALVPLRLRRRLARRQQHGHIRRPDGRAVDLREATVAAAVGLRGHVCRRDRVQRQFPPPTTSSAAVIPTADGIVSGPLTASPTRPGNSRRLSTQLRPCLASQAPTRVPTCRSTVPVAPTSGWTSCGYEPPAGTSYRLWPSYPTIPGHIDSDMSGYTLGTEFQLSQSCTLDAIWYYSRARCGRAAHQVRDLECRLADEVSGTDNSSPSWSGAAGSGWVSCAYSGVTLPAGDYKVSVFYGAGRSGTRPQRLLGRRRPGQQRHHHRAGHRAQPGRRHEPWAVHRITMAPGPIRRLTLPAPLARTTGSTSRSRRARPGPGRCSACPSGTKRKDCHHDAFPEESPGRLGSRRSRRLQQRRIGTPLTESSSNGPYYGIVGPPGGTGPQMKAGARAAAVQFYGLYSASQFAAFWNLLAPATKSQVLSASG